MDNNKIRISIFIIISLLILYDAFFIFGLNKKQEKFNLYEISKDASYKVYLLNNDFIKDEYIGMNKTYISSLIDKINMNFNYDYTGLTENQEINYIYDVSAITYIDYSTPNAGESANLWTRKDILMANNNVATNSIKIQEPIDVDYSYYKGIIDDFKTKFNLSVNAYLDVVFSVQINVKVDDKTYTDTSTITLRANLYQPAVNIIKMDTGDKVKTINNNDKNINYTTPTLINIVIITLAVYFALRTKNKGKIIEYDRKLNKILKNYNNIIVEIINQIDFKDKEIIDVKDFEKLLDIQDEIRSPILFYNNNKQEATFILIYNDILYRYKLLTNDEK